MKKLIALFTASMFALSLGVAYAEDEGAMPWDKKPQETTSTKAKDKNKNKDKKKEKKKADKGKKKEKAKKDKKKKSPATK